jgi:DNA polymerase-3 subunit epsilon
VNLGVPTQRKASDGLDFVAFDVETANRNRGSVCAFGLAVVRGGDIVQRHTWLTRPPAGLDWFDPFNTALHGIRPTDVANQRAFADRLAEAVDVIGDLPVIGHNAAFDIGAVRDGCDADGLDWPTLTYGCSLVMARRELDLLSYRLPVVAAELGIRVGRHHDAGADAEAAAEIVLALARRRTVSSLADLLAALDVSVGRLSKDDWFGCRRATAGTAGGGYPAPPQAEASADPGHPLYGQVVVFTGALSIRREDAWARVASLGATPDKGVTKRTTILVVGDGFIGDDPAGFTTGKAAKAAGARAKGQRIEVLTEQDLLAMLAESRTAGRRPGAEPTPVC